MILFILGVVVLFFICFGLVQFYFHFCIPNTNRQIKDTLDNMAGRRRYRDDEYY